MIGHPVEGDGSGAAIDVTVIADVAIPPPSCLGNDGLGWKGVTILLGYFDNAGERHKYLRQ